MDAIPNPKERVQTAREEIVNSLSHGLMLLAALIAAPLLFVARSGRELRLAEGIGYAVFAATMVLLYLTSMVYHALPDGSSKRLFLRLDLAAIYLFIAGSYTPFAMAAMSASDGSIDPSAWARLGGVWALAVTGASLKIFERSSHRIFSTGLYLAMGWAVLIAALPLIERVPAASVFWLVAGGVAYSVGVIFFVLDSRLRFAHAVWHGFVATGTSCHFVAVLSYAA
jgi:hemolysin III